MSRLLKWRHDEVKAVYHQKDILRILLTMAHKLEEHMTGTPRTQEPPKEPACFYFFLSFPRDS